MRTITAAAVDDLASEEAHGGQIAMTVSSTDPKYQSLSVTPVAVTITDNDTVGFTVSPTAGLTTTEAGGTAQFTVRLNTQPTAVVTIPLNSSDTTEGTIGPPSSIVLLTFQPDATALNPQTVTITGVQDAIVDGNVAYTIVTGAATSGDPAYQGLDPADVSVTNLDDDGAAGVSISDASVAEGDAGTGILTFTVTLTPPSSQTVTVPFSTASGTTTPATGGAACTANVDYLAANGTLTFQPLDTSETVTVTVCADALVEGNETLLVNLGAPTGGATVADGQGVGTITDDDLAGGVSFTAGTINVPENAGQAVITVQRSGGTGPAATGATQATVSTPSGSVASGSVRPNPPAGPAGGTVSPSALAPITVSFATANGTALAGQDYVATAGTLTLGVGETTKTITIPILADNVIEGPESFIVTLSGPTGGAGLGAQATITVVIVDTSHGTAGPPGDDSADDEREARERETEEERRQRARTNQGNKDDDSVEGDVLEVRCDQPWPSVTIANRDGEVEVRLIKEAQAACSSIHVGDYLEADGEKQHEGLFHANSVDIKRRR